MSDSYLDGKVREALLAAKGSVALAQSTLIVWAAKDERLLRTMVQPFIKAIAGDAIARALKRGVTVPGLGRPAPKPRVAVSQEDLRRVLDQMGSGTVGGEPDEGGGESPTLAGILGRDPRGDDPKGARPSRQPEPTIQTVDQANTIRTLAAVYAKNRKRP